MISNNAIIISSDHRSLASWELFWQQWTFKNTEKMIEWFQATDCLPVYANYGRSRGYIRFTESNTEIISIVRGRGREQWEIRGSDRDSYVGVDHSAISSWRVEYSHATNYPLGKADRGQGRQEGFLDSIKKYGEHRGKIEDFRRMWSLPFKWLSLGLRPKLDTGRRAPYSRLRQICEISPRIVDVPCGGS